MDEGHVRAASGASWVRRSPSLLWQGSRARTAEKNKLQGSGSSWPFLLLLSSVSFGKLHHFFFLLRRAACGILVPRPEMQPAPVAMEARSLHHWTDREFPTPFLHV